MVLAIEGWQTTSGLIILSLYYWCSVFVKRGMLLTVHVQVDLQSKEKQPQTVTPPPPKAVVPKLGLSWNEVFRWPQTLARPSVGRNKKRLSSDQWTRLHVRIVHPKWSCDQSNRAWRWRNVNCGHFMGRRARIPWWWRRLIMYFSTFVLANEIWFFFRVLSFIFYWFGMVRRKLTIPKRWQAVGMHNGGLSHRRVADHFRVNHSIIVRLMQRFRQTGNVTDRPRAGRPRKTTPREDRLISRRARQRPFSTAGALRGNLAFLMSFDFPFVRLFGVR
jgi:hypothetical protein